MGCLIAIVVAFIAFLMFGVAISFIQNAWPVIGLIIVIWAIHKVWVYYKEKE